jgi:hypothetical protein
MVLEMTGMIGAMTAGIDRVAHCIETSTTPNRLIGCCALIVDEQEKSKCIGDVQDYRTSFILSSYFMLYMSC